MTYSGWPTFTLEIAPGWSPLDASPTWRDITSYCTWDLRTERGKSADSENANAGKGSFTLDDGDTRDFDPLNTSSKWYATYLNLTGASGATASTPTSVALGITGDLDIRILASATDWTSAFDALASKWNNTAQRSWFLQLNTDATLSFVYSTNGSATAGTRTSTAALPATDGSPMWVRCTFDADNGAAGHTVAFYYSTDTTLRHDEVTWTQLGSSVVTAGTVTLWNSTSSFMVGGVTGAAVEFTGKVWAAALLSGIAGTVVASPDFTVAIGAGVTSFTDTQSNTWTVNGAASITADTDRGSWIRPRLPVRFRGNISATDYGVFRGHVNSVTQQYPPGQRLATLNCSDLFNVMATVSVSERSAWAASIEALKPVAWWRLGEQLPSGATTLNGVEATDETGRYNGFYAGDTPVPAAAGLIDGDQSGAFSTGTNGAVFITTAYPYASNETAVVLIWFTCPTIGGSDRVILNSGYPLYVKATTGLLVWERPSSADIITSASRVDDGLPHCVALVNPSIAAAGARPGTMYLDGVSQGTASNLAPLSGSWFVGIDYDGTRLFQNGVIDELVALNTTIDSTKALDLYNAGHSSWEGETTGARIQRAVDLVGIPSALLDLDTGDSTVVGWTGGSTALDVGQKCNTTEQGVLVVEGNGKLTFIARSALYNLAVTATLGDSGSDNTYAANDGESAEGQIINRARYTSSAGTALAYDTASIKAYGVQDGDRSTLDDSIDALAAGAQYAVARWKDPQSRITTLEIDPTYDGTTGWQLVLGLLIGQRVTFKRTFTVGSNVQDDFIITGIKHSGSRDQWRTVLQVTTADTQTYFTLDDNTLGLLDGAGLLAF